VYYRLNPALPAWVHTVLSTTLHANSAWLEADSARLQTMAGRPARATCC
jgi:ArsR family transcriptional regulator